MRTIVENEDDGKGLTSDTRANHSTPLLLLLLIPFKETANLIILVIDTILVREILAGPLTSLTCAWPPNLPSASTSILTRVPSVADFCNWSIMVLIVYLRSIISLMTSMEIFVRPSLVTVSLTKSSPSLPTAARICRETCFRERYIHPSGRLSR